MTNLSATMIAFWVGLCKAPCSSRTNHFVEDPRRARRHSFYPLRRRHQELRDRARLRLLDSLLRHRQDFVCSCLRGHLIKPFPRHRERHGLFPVGSRDKRDVPVLAYHTVHLPRIFAPHHLHRLLILFALHFRFLFCTLYAVLSYRDADSLLHFGYGVNTERL